MRGSGWTPSTVPYGADQTMYLVIDKRGHHGGVYRETEVERSDLETVMADLMAGQFNEPIRVVAFNTLEHWSKDVSPEIAREIVACCDSNGSGVPDHLADFVERYRGQGDLLRAVFNAAALTDHGQPGNSNIVGRVKSRTPRPPR